VIACEKKRTARVHGGASGFRFEILTERGRGQGAARARHFRKHLRHVLDPDDSGQHEGMDNDGRGITLEAGITDQRIEQHCGWLANAPDVTELRRL
jgi:hypothetical protein